MPSSSISPTTSPGHASAAATAERSTRCGASGHMTAKRSVRMLSSARAPTSAATYSGCASASAAAVSHTGALDGLSCPTAADCFILTFRAIATASKLTWRHLDCDAEGMLDRSDGVLRFTALHLRARLVLPAGGDTNRAKRLLEKAEAACLVTNSLALRPTLAAEVTAKPEDLEPTPLA